MASSYQGGVALKIDAKTGFVAVATGSDYGAEEVEIIASDMAYFAAQNKTFVQAFIPETKGDKVVKIGLRSGGEFAVSGFKPATIEKLLTTHTPRILVKFAGRAPMPYLAFFKKADDKPAIEKKKESSFLGRRS